MKGQRVLILSTESLLSDSIRHLLKSESDIVVVGVAPLAPVPLESISRLQPDIVIIADGDPYIDAASTLHTLRATFVDLPLIWVGLSEPRVRMYHSRQEPAASLTLKEALAICHVHTTQSDEYIMHRRK